MTHRAIVGHGRLLTMDGPPPGGTGLVEGPWVLDIADGRIREVRRGGLRRGDPELLGAMAERAALKGLVLTEFEPPLDPRGRDALDLARLVCRALDGGLGPRRW